MKKSIENKIEKLIQEGFVDKIKDNKLATGLGIGALGAGAYGLNHLMDEPSMDEPSMDKPSMDKPSIESVQDTKYLLNKYDNVNKEYEEDNELKNNKLDGIQSKIDNTLQKFVGYRSYSQPSLNNLVNQYADLRPLTQDELINQRDAIDNYGDKAFKSKVDFIQNNQSKLSDEYQKIDSSRLPNDILRKADIIKDLSSPYENVVPYRSQFDAYNNFDDRSSKLTDRILNYGNKEQQDEWRTNLSKQDDIVNKIDKNYGKYSSPMTQFDKLTSDKINAEEDIATGTRHYNNKIYKLNSRFYNEDLSK